MACSQNYEISKNISFINIWHVECYVDVVQFSLHDIKKMLFFVLRIKYEVKLVSDGRRSLFLYANQSE